MDDIGWIREALGRIETQLSDGSEKCRVRHSILDKELTAIKIKAGLFGALAGLGPSLVMLIAYLTKH